MIISMVAKIIILIIIIVIRMKMGATIKQKIISIILNIIIMVAIVIIIVIRMKMGVIRQTGESGPLLSWEPPHNDQQSQEGGIKEFRRRWSSSQSSLGPGQSSAGWIVGRVRQVASSNSQLLIDKRHVCLQIMCLLCQFSKEENKKRQG